MTLKDSSWLLTLTIFHQPEVLGQPSGTSLWWGYGLYPERDGDFVKKRMDHCTGAEILEEALRHLRFDQLLGSVLAVSICIPCDLPYVNNIWLPRRSTDRPPVPTQRERDHARHAVSPGCLMSEMPVHLSYRDNLHWVMRSLEKLKCQEPK